MPELPELLRELEKEMQAASRRLEFEQAAEIRDLLLELKGMERRGSRLELLTTTAPPAQAPKRKKRSR